LDSALHKLLGVASEQGRHLQEGQKPRFEETENGPGMLKLPDFGPGIELMKNQE
jgi:hypothetical protein